MKNGYIYSESDVRKMWNRPYGQQIVIAQSKALEAILKAEGKIYVSLSGGKDSAVLLYIVAQMWIMSKYKNEKLIVIFANTSNEFNCMSKYTKEYCKYIEDFFAIKIDLLEVRAQNHYFDIVREVGFPFVSKKISRHVRDVRSQLSKLNMTYSYIEQFMPSSYTKNNYKECLLSANKLRELGFTDTIILNLTKITSKDIWCGSFFLSQKWRPLLDADFKISEKCCEKLKKNPIKNASKEIGKLLPIVGEMAIESRDRLRSYRKTGCNSFDLPSGQSKSKPLGALTELTILRFIFENKIPIATIYGELIKVDDNSFYFTQEKRTGCKLCGFGIARDYDRFLRLQKYEPQVVKFAFTKLENGGLGYSEICEFLNENCGTSIIIPKIEQGNYIISKVLNDN